MLNAFASQLYAFQFYLPYNCKKNWQKNWQKQLFSKKKKSYIWQLTVGSWQVAVGRWQLAGGSWQVAVGMWQVVVSRWQVAGGMWPNCLGAVRKAGIRCLHWPLG